MSLTDFWKSLTPEEKEKLRPYLEVERGAMLSAIVSNRIAMKPYIVKKRRRILV